MTISSAENKHIAVPRSKRRIKDFSDIDLADRIDSLHRAVANERAFQRRDSSPTANTITKEADGII